MPDREERQKIEETIQQLESAKASGALNASFVDTSIAALKKELATYTASATSGASAQGPNAKAVGEKGVMVGGNVGGSINTGTVTYFFNRYEAPAGKSQLDKDQFERILREYLAWVVKAYGRAKLYGLENAPATREQPRRALSDVFVPLTLRRFSPPRRDEIEELAGEFKGDPLAHQRAYLRAVENRRTDGDAIDLVKLLTVNDRLAVIGGAGSGKSTLAAFLAASLAQAALDGSPSAMSLPKKRENLLPLVIPLRYLREYQRICAENSREKLKNPRTGKLAGFIPWYLMRRSPALELSEDFFDRLLLGGGCLLVLDGLDEVVNRTERGQVRAQVESLANDIYPGNLVMVTARESGYREDAVFGDDFVRLDVQPLDDGQIEQLVGNWCAQLYPEAVQAQTREMMSNIADINQRYEQQRLPRLVSTPLMTTMVVSVKWGENELPRERAQLYEAAVKVILQAQYIEKDEAQEELVNWGGAWHEQRDWLSFLALEMHRGGRDGAAIPEERVRAILSHYPGMDAARLDTFIQAVRLRGGLLDERAELFQFAHLTIQEFLAARYLAKEREKAFTALAGHVNDSWWRETFLLIYGFAKMDYSRFAAEYLHWLSNLHHSENAALAGLELAGAALLEIERPDPAAYQTQAALLCKAFEKPEQDTSAALRVLAGNTLSALGDPRFDPERWYLPKDPNLGFIRIPAGKFIMGSKQDEGYDDERPQHELDLPDYWMSKYPVTVAQYRAFVEASGYKTTDQNSLGGTLNHPVAYVTWYDALEYCKWLNKQLSAISHQLSVNGNTFWEGIASGSLTVSLPSEAEWEKAARSPSPFGDDATSSGDGRVYPWGDKADPNKANYDETGIGGTSPVGAFPAGQSPYGLLDMSGNVWEWTRSFGYNVSKYPYNPTDGREDISRKDVRRAVRGGSFALTDGLVRCALRNWYDPDFWDVNLGFRVVVFFSPRFA